MPSKEDGEGTDAAGEGEGMLEPSPSNETGAMQQRGCIQTNRKTQHRAWAKPARFMLITTSSVKIEQSRSASENGWHANALLRVGLKLKVQLWQIRTQCIKACKIVIFTHQDLCCLIVAPTAVECEARGT